MGWLENQEKISSLRDHFLKNPYNAWQFQEQNRFFSENLEDLIKAIKFVGNLVKNAELTKNKVYLIKVSQTPTTIQTICGIYRDDGYVYFGRGEALTTLGLGGRFKDDELEFYDQYKDKLI